MKYDRFFELAKQAGAEEAELHFTQAHELSFSLFHGEVDNYSDNNSFTIGGRGIVNGRLGSASCDVWSKEKAEFLVNEMILNAKINESDDPAFIFGGSEKYKKVSTYNKDFEKITIDEKMAKLHQLEEKIKALDPRVIEVEGVEYSEAKEVRNILNSKGLKLSQKSNYFFYVGAVVVKEGEQVKTNSEFYFGNEFEKFDVDKLAKKIVDNAVAQLGGEACQSGNYKAVLSPNVVKSLTSFFISSASAEEVQKRSSLFMEKLGQKVASSKVTIEDRPLDKTLFATGFDSEGVATYNKPIVKNGVLKTYLYNLTTAAKGGTQTTGNASGAGSKSGIAPHYLYFKPGKKTQEELFQEVGEGVYITEVQGLHAGMNAQSGNFSLQSTGFLIKDGKKDRGLDIITISGNLMDLFKNIIEVGSDSTQFISAITCPSVLIKKIAVGGK